MNMIEVKTAKLTGAALDWVVVEAVGSDFQWPGIFVNGKRVGTISPSVNWAEGGPLIDEYAIEVKPTTDAWWGAFDNINFGNGGGSTALIAACRAIVDGKLGEVVRVPAELVQEVSCG